ncbi:hypothetical protein [Celeribacter sp.]|uniref:hypothetical protein n=1 Tax=Celeribacter sp. TaxID=1890673 RepID=UPI003A8D3A00
MKKIVAMMAVAISVLISEKSAADGVDKSASCELVGETAAMVMQARQWGVPLSDVMSLFDPDDMPFAYSFAIIAYEMPRYSSDYQREKAVFEFGDWVQLQCFKRRQ